MDKYVIFISGVFGGSISTFMNSVLKVDTKSEFIQKFVFGFSFDSIISASRFLKQIEHDAGTLVIVLFDVDMNKIVLRKGDGPVNDIIDAVSHSFVEVYQESFGLELSFSAVEDGRQYLETISQN